MEDTLFQHLFVIFCMKHPLSTFALILTLSNITAQESQTTLAVLDFEPRGINSLEAATLTDRFTSEIGKTEAIPLEYALHENYPNPFNPTTTLRFDLPEISDITLTIYNMLGQKVKTFNMQSTPAGYHSVTWNATNDLGEQVGAGVYLYQLQTKDFVKTRKMVLLK